jgi:hypothetical protein
MLPLAEMASSPRKPPPFAGWQDAFENNNTIDKYNLYSIALSE